MGAEDAEAPPITIDDYLGCQEQATEQDDRDALRHAHAQTVSTRSTRQSNRHKVKNISKASKQKRKADTQGGTPGKKGPGLAAGALPAVTGAALEAAKAATNGPVQLKFVVTAQSLMLLGHATMRPSMIKKAGDFSTKPNYIITRLNKIAPTFIQKEVGWWTLVDSLVPPGCPAEPAQAAPEPAQAAAAKPAEEEEGEMPSLDELFEFLGEEWIQHLEARMEGLLEEWGTLPPVEESTEWFKEASAGFKQALRCG